MAKKRLTSVEKQPICEKYDKYLRVITFFGDNFMLQKQFVKLCFELKFIENEYEIKYIIRQFEEFEIIKKIRIGKSNTVIIAFTKYPIRYLKGVDSSHKVSAKTRFKSEIPHLMSVMKMDLILNTVIPILKDRNEDITLSSIKKFLNTRYCTLLYSEKNAEYYYSLLYQNNKLDDEQKNKIRQAYWASIALRAKNKLNLNAHLSELEKKSLMLLEKYESNDMNTFRNDSILYEKLLKIKNRRGRSDGTGGVEEIKAIHMLSRSNFYIQSIWIDVDETLIRYVYFQSKMEVDVSKTLKLLELAHNFMHFIFKNIKVELVIYTLSDDVKYNCERAILKRMNLNKRFKRLKEVEDYSYFSSIRYGKIQSITVNSINISNLLGVNQE